MEEASSRPRRALIAQLGVPEGRARSPQYPPQVRDYLHSTPFRHLPFFHADGPPTITPCAVWVANWYYLTLVHDCCRSPRGAHAFQRGRARFRRRSVVLAVRSYAPRRSCGRGAVDSASTLIPGVCRCLKVGDLSVRTTQNTLQAIRRP